MVEDKRKAMQGHAAFDESESETRMASLEGTMYLKRKVGTMVRWSLSCGSLGFCDLLFYCCIWTHLELVVLLVLYLSFSGRTYNHNRTPMRQMNNNWGIVNDDLRFSNSP